MIMDVEGKLIVLSDMKAHTQYIFLNSVRIHDLLCCALTRNQVLSFIICNIAKGSAVKVYFT